jgi:hypothetical protein
MRNAFMVALGLFLLAAYAYPHGESEAQEGDPGSCDCFNANVFAAECVTQRTTWFGFCITYKTYPLTSGGIVKIPGCWYSGVNDAGWGRTVQMYFKMSEHPCTGLTVRIDRGDGSSYQHGWNPRAPRYPAGGTGTLGGGLADGAATARLFCACCPGLCAKEHCHVQRVP